MSKNIEDKVDSILNNHLPTMDKAIGKLQTDMSWVKKNQRWAFGIAATTLIGIIFILIKLI